MKAFFPGPFVQIRIVPDYVRVGDERLETECSVQLLRGDSNVTRVDDRQ